MQEKLNVNPDRVCTNSVHQIMQDVQASMRKKYLHRFRFAGKLLQLEYFCLTESI